MTGGPSGADALRERLTASRDTLMQSIAGLSEEAFRRRAAPGEWTAAEVLAHLLGNEARTLEVARRALAEDEPLVQSRGEGRQLEEAKAAQRMPVPQIVHGLLAQRRETLQLLDGLSDAELARSAQHSRRGRISVDWLLQRLAGHEAEHAAQIAALRPTGVSKEA